MTVTFWGENAAEATRDYERFRDALSQNSELFVGVDEKPTKVLPGDAGIYIEGLTVKVNVDAMDNAAKN
ncbi:MAG: hypothetical protein R3F17_01595 [Planctomycetota bacterium]